jgi:NADPH-dependent 7-cyano-7-deazaguanine reductase QueF-like protein
MDLYNLRNNKVERVTLNPFQLEKEIQNLIEENSFSLNLNILINNGFRLVDVIRYKRLRDFWI